MTSIVVGRLHDQFHAWCPAFGSVHVVGATQQEALSNAEDAAISRLRTLIAQGEAIPLGRLEDPSGDWTAEMRFTGGMMLREASYLPVYLDLPFS